MFAFACVYRHRFMRILTLAHTYIGVALYGRRREAMRCTCGACDLCE